MRNRSITIDAENEEEYINKFESVNRRRSRLSLKNFDNDDDDDEYLRPKKNINKIINEEEEDDYSNLGVPIGNYEEENSYDEKLFPDSVNSTDQISSYENGLDLLCLYLKNTISSKNYLSISEKDNSIFYRNKNALHTLSGNAIYDLNIRELVDNIMDDNDNNNNENDNNGLRDFITKNIEADFKIKIMAISNTTSFKVALMNQFFNQKSNFNNSNNKDNLQLFQIRKKVIRMFNKNINIEFFDTCESFLNAPTSFIYYKLSTAFFFFIEATAHNIFNFLDNAFSKIEKYIENKTLVLIGLNMLFKEDCSIDGENLREYANDKGMIFISLKINNFDITNPLIQNLFSLILIKGIDIRKNNSSNRKNSHDTNIKGYKNNLTKKINNSANKQYKYDISKMNIQNSLGYKKQYRIKHINAFDTLDENDKLKYKRKLSIDL